MAKQKADSKAKKGNVKKTPASNSPDDEDRKFAPGILPARDLKKNLGCG